MVPFTYNTSENLIIFTPILSNLGASVSSSTYLVKRNGGWNVVAVGGSGGGVACSTAAESGGGGSSRRLQWCEHNAHGSSGRTMYKAAVVGVMTATVGVLR